MGVTACGDSAGENDKFSEFELFLESYRLCLALRVYKHCLWLLFVLFSLLCFFVLFVYSIYPMCYRFISVIMSPPPGLLSATSP